MYRHESCLSEGPARELLSPSNALKRLFLRDGDPKGTGMAQQPVFRDPVTRKEITKIDLRRWMSKKFEAAELHQFVGKAHSLRIGGATTLFELEGAEDVKGLGGWASEVFRHYMHHPRAAVRIRAPHGPTERVWNFTASQPAHRAGALGAAAKWTSAAPGGAGTPSASSALAMRSKRSRRPNLEDRE